MTANRLIESQIVAILKVQDNRQTVAQISREYGISAVRIEVTLQDWKAKYGGMQASDIKCMKESKAAPAGKKIDG